MAAHYEFLQLLHLAPGAHPHQSAADWHALVFTQGKLQSGRYSVDTGQAPCDAAAAFLA
jgi:hypothetical protein